MSLFNKVHLFSKIVREAGYEPIVRIIMHNAGSEQVLKLYSSFRYVSKSGPLSAPGVNKFWSYDFGGVLKLYSEYDTGACENSDWNEDANALALAVEFCRQWPIDQYSPGVHSKISLSVSLPSRASALHLGRLLGIEFNNIEFQDSFWLQNEQLDVNLHYKVEIGP